MRNFGDIVMRIIVKRIWGKFVWRSAYRIRLAVRIRSGDKFAHGPLCRIDTYLENGAFGFAGNEIYEGSEKGGVSGRAISLNGFGANSLGGPHAKFACGPSRRIKFEQRFRTVFGFCFFLNCVIKNEFPKCCFFCKNRQKPEFCRKTCVGLCKKHTSSCTRVAHVWNLTPI